DCDDYSGPGACRTRRFTQGSKRNADAQLRLMTLEIGKIERAQASGDRAPDLHVPRCREEISLAKGRVESRADIKGLSREIVEAKPFVMPKAARLRANKDVWHDLHRDGRANSNVESRKVSPDPRNRVCTGS